ncbi:RNA-binding protein 26 [Sarotherodon galilaeus]
MASPVLRIIFGDVSDSRKMHLDSGIPATLSELHMLVKTFFDLKEDFRLQYMDEDFNAFMNLTSMSDVKDKGTLKVIYNPKPTLEEQFITLYPVEMSTNSSVYTCQGTSSPGPSLVSSCSDDTLYTSTPHSSPDVQPTRQFSWLNVFVVPKFTYDVELELQQKNAEYEANGTLFKPGIKLKGVILDGLAQEMLKYTKYPKDYQCEEVAAALTRTHPCLGQLGSKTGFWGWKQSLKYKMQNYRTKLGRLGDPEIRVNSLKHKREGQGKTAAVKISQKAEVYYVPLPPKGESTESLETERVALLSEIKKRDNEAVIKAKMERTFSHRRLEIVEQRPMIRDFMNRWPALFKESEVNAEFLRITTKPLQAKFLAQLDNLTDKLMKIFEGSKGAKGQKIKDIMAISSLCDDIDIKREHTLKSLVIYFNEDPDLLFKEYLTSSTEDERLRSTAATVMGIYTIRREGVQEPEDVGVVIEGTTVMNNLGSVIMAFIILFGLIYALDLSYPNDLKYTFEFCQILMNLDGQRLSTKMQQMKLKMFA